MALFHQILRIRPPLVKSTPHLLHHPPHLTFPNPCYITKLEVYMVNSPSQPNSRPVAPPPPGACVRHNVALPPRRVGTARPHVSNSGHAPTTRCPRPEPRESKPYFSCPQGSIKAKTPAIKANRASSRQMINQQKTASCHRPSAPGTAGPFLGRAGAAAPPHIDINVWLVTPSTVLYQTPPAFSRLQSRQKTPVIVHDQASSRQTMKKLKPTYRAPTAQPLTSPGQRPGFAPHETSPEGATQPANQGKNPGNQG